MCCKKKENERKMYLKKMEYNGNQLGRVCKNNFAGGSCRKENLLIILTRKNSLTYLIGKLLLTYSCIPRNFKINKLTN